LKSKYPWKASTNFDKKDARKTEFYLLQGADILSNALGPTVANDLMQIASNNCSKFLKEWVCCDSATSQSGVKRDSRRARYLRSTPFYPYLSHQGLCPCLYTENPLLTGKAQWDSEYVSNPEIRSMTNPENLDTYFGHNAPWWDFEINRAREAAGNTTEKTGKNTAQVAANWTQVSGTLYCFRDWCLIGNGDVYNKEGQRTAFGLQNNFTAIQNSTFDNKCGSKELELFQLQICSNEIGSLNVLSGNSKVKLSNDCTAIQKEDKTGTNTDTQKGGKDITPPSASFSSKSSAEDGADGQGSLSPGGREQSVLRKNAVEAGLPEGFYDSLTSLQNSSLRRAVVSFLDVDVVTPQMKKDVQRVLEDLLPWSRVRTLGDGSKKVEATSVSTWSASNLVYALNRKVPSSATVNSWTDLFFSPDLYLGLTFGSLALALVFCIVGFLAYNKKSAFGGPGNSWGPQKKWGASEKTALLGSCAALFLLFLGGAVVFLFMALQYQILIPL
jgi:hypothetical protein